MRHRVKDQPKTADNSAATWKHNELSIGYVKSSQDFWTADHQRSSFNWFTLHDSANSAYDLQIVTVITPHSIDVKSSALVAGIHKRLWITTKITKHFFLWLYAPNPHKNSTKIRS